MKDLLDRVYYYGYKDSWGGSLIGQESDKIHATVRTAVKELSSIITSPNASQADKDWAKQKVEQLLKGF